MKRSAAEASRLVLSPIRVDRYLSPPPDTPYPLEFAYHLLGDVRGQTVLDLGCGSGQNLVALANRGANVLGIDVSPQLVELARQRLDNAGKSASVKVATAYETDLPDESVDVVFAIAVMHHLELPVVREEIRRILRKNGRFIFSEPIRFSRTLQYLRKLIPARHEISSYEHPLDRAELAEITQGFKVVEQRNFQLPVVMMLANRWPAHNNPIRKVDRWLNRRFPKLEQYDTVKVMSLTRSTRVQRENVA